MPCEISLVEDNDVKSAGVQSKKIYAGKKTKALSCTSPCAVDSIDVM